MENISFSDHVHSLCPKAFVRLPFITGLANQERKYNFMASMIGKVGDKFNQDDISL